MPAVVKMKNVLLGATLVGVGVVALIQLVPYGRDHANPPVTGEPRWRSRRVRELAAEACFDCHSNETRWPWYSQVAPASWLLQRDVDEGREDLNLSEWDRPQEKADEAGETVRAGEMPPLRYVLAHPAARLGEHDKRILARGLDAALGGQAGDDEDSSGPGSGEPEGPRTERG
jgi:hypothetical protein